MSDSDSDQEMFNINLLFQGEEWEGDEIIEAPEVLEIEPPPVMEDDDWAWVQVPALNTEYEMHWRKIRKPKRSFHEYNHKDVGNPLYVKRPRPQSGQYTNVLNKEIWDSIMEGSETDIRRNKRRIQNKQ